MIKNETVNRGIAYIINHLNEEISLEDVARHCNYSKYYFSRMFREETGESVYAFITRLKLNQSAINLQTKRGKSITDICLDYGYSPSSYSLAFQKQLHSPPSRFRKATNGVYPKSPFYSDDTSKLLPFAEYDKNITIQTWDAFSVIYERHIGNYIELKDKWGPFIEKYSAHADSCTKLMERSYDDPAVTSANMCIYEMCMTVKTGCPLPNITTIQGGRYAVYPYEGPVAGIYTAVQGVFHGWLPDCNYETAGPYGLNVYHHMDIENLFVKMDVCIPVK